MIYPALFRMMGWNTTSRIIFSTIAVIVIIASLFLVVFPHLANFMFEVSV